MFRIVPLELETHFAEGTVNAFLVMGESVTLVDTGNPGKESFQQLKEKLHINDVTVNDLDKIVLTHIHIDHAGAISHLQHETDVPIFVHEQARGSINAGIHQFEREQQFFQQFLKECGADPAKHIIKRRYMEEKWRNVSFVKEGDVLPIGGVGFEVVHVPGHSQCDILLWNRETGDAIAGDHLLKAFSVNAFIEPPPQGQTDRPKPLLQYRGSLEKVSKLPLKNIYPGHGEPFGDHLSLIHKRFLEQERRCDQILQLLANGEMSIFEICGKMYPHLQGKTVFLGLSQIQGHLDLLEQRQLVCFEKRDSLMLYHAK
ncbi:MBL fold metallo-hydrolase [Neobacillus sp. MM2021_6]|uniref:MBL fold metallo-hydrolase n=1 Tax=Bacillaceae TaxID=186817 RepID=UPI001409E46E|nr:MULTISPECIES: MBL fold metallo-hydrolase [Bacillaceae]MBO0961816.1 MBL fold metallo-hydrolase [Neobacillus sp. MM2021_6]NHC20237.1 MBL fold metallo-hydrolase [Bacillus sp. MM2020_4]